MAFSVVLRGYFLSILMEWGERDVLFHKTIFIFEPLWGSKIKIWASCAGSGPDGPEKFFASKKFLSSLALAQLSMQASKVVAAKAARFLKGNATWILLCAVKRHAPRTRKGPSRQRAPRRLGPLTAMNQLALFLCANAPRAAPSRPACSWE